MNKNLPIFDIILNETDLEQGVSMISLVDEPAIGVDWIKLAQETVMKMDFAANKDKRMLYGPFLIPNMLIYRRNEQMGEFYIRFSKEEIEKIAEKFNQDLNATNINFMHSDKKVQAFVAENWVIDGADKSNKFGFDLPEGTWFGGVKVVDENFWNEAVKTEEVKGFSVEILADSQLALKNIINNMEKQIKLAQVATNDGVAIFFDGDAIAKDTAVFADEAMTTPMGDGEYELTDGSKIKVMGGMVAEIMPADPNAAPADANMADAPAAQALTAEEVSKMIDARFADLMTEITALKALVEPLQKQNESYSSQITDLTEKLSAIPATGSIKKDDRKPKMVTSFEKESDRLRMLFSKK